MSMLDEIRRALPAPGATHPTRMELEAMQVSEEEIEHLLGLQVQALNLLRDKLELATALLDQLILGDIAPMLQHPLVAQVLQALGQSEPSLTRVLQTTNDATMSACLNLLGATYKAAADERVTYNEFAEVFSLGLKRVTDLYAASKNSGQ